MLKTAMPLCVIFFAVNCVDTKGDGFAVHLVWILSPAGLVIPRNDGLFLVVGNAHN